MAYQLESILQNIKLYPEELPLYHIYVSKLKVFKPHMSTGIEKIKCILPIFAAAGQTLPNTFINLSDTPDTTFLVLNGKFPVY